MNKQELKEQLEETQLRLSTEISRLQDAIDALPSEPEPLEAIQGHVYRHDDGGLFLCIGSWTSKFLFNLRTGNAWSYNCSDPFNRAESEFTYLGSFEDWLNKRMEVTETDVRSAACGRDLRLDHIAEDLTRILQEREQ